jgi:hypothetical protein
MQITLPRLFQSLSEALLAPPLSRQVESHQEQRRQLLAQLRSFEAETLRLRKAVNDKLIMFSSVAPELREWVGYSDEHYCKQMAARYVRHRFDKEAERVEAMLKSGSKRVTVTEDENGNVVSETVSTKGKAPLSNAVQFEF